MEKEKQRNQIFSEEFADKVLVINRVAKKIKGGDKIGFAALVAVGNRNGRVGLGYGKAQDLRSAITKANSKAKRKVFTVTLKDSTLPRRILIKDGAVEILLMPAPRGAGLIAGGVVRSILELAGVKDVSTKIIGTRNPMINAQATIKALEKLNEKHGSV
jgi:small subunit ribosomal protein S5